MSMRKDVEITKADQQNINSFSKMFMKTQHQEEYLTGNKDIYQHNLDAIEELGLGIEEDIVPFKLGNTFFHIASKCCQQDQEAHNIIKREQGEIKEKINQLQKELNQLKKKMNKLKTTLYSKFGSSINLDQ